MTSRLMKFALIGVFGFFVANCATVAPQELVDARNAYTRTTMGPAAQVVPQEVHKAKEALEAAESSFKADEDSQRTKDLAYVAERKAQTAEALAQQELAMQKKQKASREYQDQLSSIHERTQKELRMTREELAAEQERSKATAEQLAKLGAIQDERGTVVTLSGSVLFASNEATLLPESQSRLGQVSEALMEDKEKTIVIQGHTDSRGPDSYNSALSQRRADAVRDYLVSRGYDASKIQTQGAGETHPIASNATAEGRANNRRVEIIIERP